MVPMLVWRLALEESLASCTLHMSTAAVVRIKSRTRLLCFSHKLYGCRGNQHGVAMFRVGFFQGIIVALLAPIIAEKGTDLDTQPLHFFLILHGRSMTQMRVLEFVWGKWE